MIHVRVETGAFDCGVEIDRLSGAGTGAIASFIGIVRGDGGLTSLTLEHYPAMTDRALHQLADHAAERWGLHAVTIIHRVGTMVPGDRIVFVGTAAAHRAGALDACAFLIDALKTRAPFWKRESFADGRSGWVDARQADEAAAARWV
ncbi:molybdopterin synthase catalytic subunit MoaE [soil metagenome]